MGVTGGLVRIIFFRNKSFAVHDYKNGRSNLGEKKRWSSVRSYLCGDEFNSVLAVDDSGSIKDSVDAPLTMSPQLSLDLVTPFDSVLAIEGSASVKQHLEGEDSVSVKSSEVSVTQPLHEEKSKVVRENVDNQSETTEKHIPKKHLTTPISKLFIEEDAAVIIQSSFRSYLAKHRSKEVEDTFVKEETFSGDESQGKVSMGTSLEVQTCNSVKAPFSRRKRLSANQRTSQKNKIQVLRIKEDWDDSTVSSTISKSRIQSRIEALTKRERALAYAFSQQLRICSKKKQIDCSSEDESNIGWSWLERWMATRVPDSILIEPRINIQADPVTKNQRLVRNNRSFSIAGELESCASNDIPLQFESLSETLEEETEGVQKEKSTIKTGVSKRNLFQTTKARQGITGFRQAKETCNNRQRKLKKAKTSPSCKMGNEWEETSRKLHSCN